MLSGKYENVKNGLAKVSENPATAKEISAELAEKSENLKDMTKTHTKYNEDVLAGTKWKIKTGEVYQKVCYIKLNRN